MTNCAGFTNGSNNLNQNPFFGNSTFVPLTASPFVNPGTPTSVADAFARFAPNTTAGGGALLRGAGYPAYQDIGAVQHADPVGGGGGGGLLLSRAMNGGYSG